MELLKQLGLGIVSSLIAAGIIAISRRKSPDLWKTTALFLTGALVGVIGSYLIALYFRAPTAPKVSIDRIFLLDENSQSFIFRKDQVYNRRLAPINFIADISGFDTDPTGFYNLDIVVSLEN